MNRENAVQKVTREVASRKKQSASEEGEPSPKEKSAVPEQNSGGSLDESMSRKEI